MRKSRFTEAQIIGMIKEQGRRTASTEWRRRMSVAGMVSARRRSTSSRPSMAAWTCPMPKG